jgi:hypothetical protein
VRRQYRPADTTLAAPKISARKLLLAGTGKAEPPWISCTGEIGTRSQHRVTRKACLDSTYHPWNTYPAILSALLAAARLFAYLFAEPLGRRRCCLLVDHGARAAICDSLRGGSNRHFIAASHLQLADALQ